MVNYTYTICKACDSLNKVNSEKALENKAICGKCNKELILKGLVSEVNGNEFERIVAKSDLPVIVDFWASWCGPCQIYGPEYEKASKEVFGKVFLKVNTESEQFLANKFGIRGIPCTIVLQSGKEIKRQSGAMSAQQLKEFIR